MRFKGATIKDYKRFTDLTVQGIPEAARLIMLAGPNGSGKSSFFDALSSWHKLNSRGNPWNDDYHMKVYEREVGQWDQQQISIAFHDPMPSDEQGKKKLVYTRSAFRNEPDFQSNRVQRVPDPLDETRVDRMIDNDVAISRNYQRLVGQVFDIFGAEPMMTNEFTSSLISPVRDPVNRLFPDLVLNGLSNPMEDGTFRFTKKASEGFHFKNLSGGEKAVFDLVLDLVIAKRAYDNTLFCIDEPEAHMNARLQAELLSVLYELIPESCQLILATHSIGMMRRARDIEVASPGSVIFLDFGELDFDQPQVIEPTIPDRAFWNLAYEVALADLAELVAPERVIICEGEPKLKNAGQNYSHDARCYERIFQDEFPESQFVPGGNASEVADDKRGIGYAIGLLIKGAEVLKLIDLDDQSPEEVSDMNAHGVRVLSRRNLETFLFDDEVLCHLGNSLGKSDKVEELFDKKRSIRASRPDDRPDDLKPASGQIYLACKDVLGLTQPGETVRTFMRDTLSPIINPEMQVYKDLKRDIFGTTSI